MILSRREFLLASAFSSLASKGAFALGRIPYGSELRLAIPWPVGGFDPHSLHDPVAMLFADAVCDPLFGIDSRGRAYPALAVSLPERKGTELVVELRPDLRTGRRRALGADQVAWSLSRSRRLGAAGLLAPFGNPKARGSRLIAFDTAAAPADLARALASPLTAVIPKSFTEREPDGTGAFTATVRRNRLHLARNDRAARGPAFLDAIEIRPTGDLAASLRAFEAGETDLGWLGAGLHRRRKDAVGFQGPSLGWVVLRTGTEAGRWGAPGVAQRLIDAAPADRLKHLGLRDLDGPGEGSGWGGSPAELLVLSTAPHLVEVARALAGSLSRSGHEITVAPKSAAALARARRSDRYALMLDIVRHLGDDALALLTAADPRLAMKPPKVRRLRRLTSTLRLGVVGEVRLKGAHAKEVHGIARWQLGGVWREG